MMISLSSAPSSIAVLFLVLVLGVYKTHACPYNVWIGDGYCDEDCNTAEFQWDGGDCCNRTCVDNDYECGVVGFDCQDPAGKQYLFVKEYTNFTLTFQCDEAAPFGPAGYPIRYSYSLNKDMEDLGRKDHYTKDDTVPTECQQFSSSSKKLPSYGTDDCSSSSRQTDPDCYDRGHIVAAAHMNDNPKTKYEVGYATNILPQSSGFNLNGGSWYETEKIIEEHRDCPDVERLDIFGGMIYNDESNDKFLEKYGIPTPDIYYKVVMKVFKTGEPDVIAWIMDNNINSTKSKLDKTFKNGGHLISIKELKDTVPDADLSILPADYTESAFSAGKSWDANKCELASLNDDL